MFFDRKANEVRMPENAPSFSLSGCPGFTVSSADEVESIASRYPGCIAVLVFSSTEEEPVRLAKALSGFGYAVVVSASGRALMKALERIEFSPLPRNLAGSYLSENGDIKGIRSSLLPVYGQCITIRLE